MGDTTAQTHAAPRVECWRINGEYMANPHIIVGSDGRCICGVYGTPDEHGITCAMVVADIERLQDASLNDDEMSALRRIRAVISRLVEERS